MRIYNGCPEPKLQALINTEHALMRKIREIEPEAHCTYFPLECTHHIHVWGRSLSGHMSSRLGAIYSAIDRLDITINSER